MSGTTGVHQCHVSSPPRSACARRRSAPPTTRSELRTAIKKVRTAGSPAEASEALAKAAAVIDRAGRKNLVHRNAAARTKSRLAKMVNAKK